MMENVSTKMRKYPWELESARPGEKVAQLILAALDPNASVQTLCMPIHEEHGPSECLIIDGHIQGNGHRVLVNGIDGTGNASRERLHRLAGYKKSLSADAGIICVGGGISGEALLLCLKLGLIPVECDPYKGIVRIHMGTVTVVRHVSIRSWMLSVYLSPNDRKGQVFDDKTKDLIFQGKPIRNWLSRESRKMMQKVKGDCTVSAKYSLKKPFVFEIEGKNIDVGCFETSLECRIQNRVHSIQADLGDVEYNPRLRKVLWSKNVPRERKELARIPGILPEDAPLLGKNTECKPELHVYHPVAGAPGPGLPDLDQHIQSTSVRILEL